VSSRFRLITFGVLAVVCVAAAVVAVTRGKPDNGALRVSSGASRVLADAHAAGRPMIVFRDLPGGRATGDAQVVLAPAAQPNESRTYTPLRCARVYFASGRGICIARSRRIGSPYRAEIFGADLKVTHSLDLGGLPSRTRVSPDGRYGATTVFVTGHAYAAPGSFSTQTTLIDLASGSKIADLEQFTTTRNGRQVTAIDVNYWGVTFARDSDRFYATLATGGKTYLIQGSVSDRTAHVIAENVECPSLSPDGARIAFKKRVGSQANPWRLTVLDLASMRETPLAETRSVDDQVEWRDDHTVLYGLNGAVWSVPADGTGTPRRYIAGADSPATVRWSSKETAPQT
jgi:hypothetical protein